MWAQLLMEYLQSHLEELGVGGSITGVLDLVYGSTFKGNR